MDLFIYSDESGVFDKEHNEIYVYGGLIFLGKEQKDDYARKYIAAEKSLRGQKYAANEELKACRISNKEKGKLYRSMNGAIRFGVIVNQKNVLERIFQSKKDKQRYLDFAYKIGLKKALQKMIADGIDTFIEIGPGKTLAGFMRKIDKEKKVTMFNVEKIEDLEKIAALCQG